MARYLALDWEAGFVHLLAATTAKGATKYERAVSWPEDQPLTAATGEALGIRLRERLKEAKIATAPLLAVVGREKLILKDVRYPAVPLHEEPGIVRFQAVKELNDNPDDVVIDYQAFEIPESNGERKAMAVAVRKDVLAAYQAVAKGLGVKLVALTPRSYGVVASLLRTANPAPEPGTAFAVLTVGPRGGEFTVSRGSHVAFARSVLPQSLASDTALLSEIRRNLAVYAGQSGQYPVRALYVAEGAGSLGVADRLRDTLAVPVYRFDPLVGLANVPADANPGAFAGATGLIELQAESSDLPINFAQPREPKPPVNPLRKYALYAAGLAGSLLLALGAFGYSRLAAKDKVLSELVAQKAEIDSELAAREPEERRLKAIDDWMANQVSMLDELYELTAVVPDTNKMRVTSFAVNPINQVGRKRYPARVELKGLVGNDVTPVTVVQKELAAETFYRVENKVVSPNNTGSSRGNYPQQFSLRYDVEKRPVEKFSRAFKAEPPPKRGQRQGGQSGPGAGGMGNLLEIFGGGMRP